MLASITVKKQPHVGAEIGMGAAPIVVSVATCSFFPALRCKKNSSIYQIIENASISQSKPFGQALRTIAANHRKLQHGP